MIMSGRATDLIFPLGGSRVGDLDICMDCLPLESLQGSDVVFTQVELPFVF